MVKTHKIGHKGGDIFGDMARQGAKSLIDVGANALKQSLGGKVKRGGSHEDDENAAMHAYVMQTQHRQGGDLLGDIARQGAKSLIDVGANALKNSLGGRVQQRRYKEKHGGDYTPFGFGVQQGGDLFGDMAREGAKSLIDVGANALKNSLGGKVKCHLTHHQVKTLCEGGAITLHPKHTHHTGRYEIRLGHKKSIRLIKAHAKNKGMKVKLEQGEGLFDTLTQLVHTPLVKDLIKAGAPHAIDYVSDKIKHHAHPYAHHLVDFGSHHAKKAIAGYGVMKKSHKGGMVVRPMLSTDGSTVPVRELSYTGGALRGHNHTRMMDDMDMPIQLGSPYIKTHSPAFHPYFNNKGIQSYNPIDKKKGGSFEPSGTGMNDGDIPDSELSVNAHYHKREDQLNTSRQVMPNRMYNMFYPPGTPKGDKISGAGTKRVWREKEQNPLLM
jgi:hypothetical protein